jgi:hypothetical protein
MWKPSAKMRVEAWRAPGHDANRKKKEGDKPKKLKNTTRNGVSVQLII